MDSTNGSLTGLVRAAVMAILTLAFLIFPINDSVRANSSTEAVSSQNFDVAYVHTVKQGETLWDIAGNYNTTIEELVRLNGLVNPNVLQPGQKLTIFRTEGVYHTIQRGDTLWGISNRYGVPMDDIVKANNITRPNSLTMGQRLVISSGVSRQVNAAVASTNRSAAVAVRFRWPLTGRITSKFGPRWGGFHYGIDIATSSGTPIKAAMGGVVERSGWIGSYGYTVIVDHGNGYKTLYAHASRLLVSRGQRVEAGQNIARVGSTGNSTGPHLHFEVIRNRVKVNPANYL